MSGVHGELAEQICDVAREGYGTHLDGLGSEGHSIAPEQFAELMWDQFPGMYAREASHVRLAPDDLRLIVSLDQQQRDGKGLPRLLVETLELPASYLDDWQQIPLPGFGLSAS